MLLSNLENHCIKNSLQELISLLDQPWDASAMRKIELFDELTKTPGGVTALVTRLQATNSQYVVQAVSGLLAFVESYLDEIPALYQWIAHLPDWIDEKSIGNLATAVQRHIGDASQAGLPLPPEPVIQRIMIPFLIHCLTARDWAIWDSAVWSLTTLDDVHPLEKWLTSEEKARLANVLVEQLKIGKGEGDFSDIGSLQRFVTEKK